MVSRGFPDRARCTPVPDVFFSHDLPALGDPVAIKVFLHLAWRIHRRPPRSAPAMRLDVLLADATLRRGILALGVEAEAIAAAIEAAVARLADLGLLLGARLAGADQPEQWLMLNDRAGRAFHARLADTPALLPGGPAPETLPAAPRPTVFALYEQNIGLLTPLVVEDLREAEAIYPWEWIEDAMRHAVAHNARRWSYVRAILERWAVEGREEGRKRHATDRRRDPAVRKRDSEGPYAAFVER